MSNTLAIGTVSAAVGQIIQDALDVDVPGATISYDRPGGANESALHGTNIFLYQILPSTYFRNADLPARSQDGRLVNRPCVSLDLNFLFTFYGDQALFEPERMAASLARALHQTPLLGRGAIEAAVAANPSALQGSDLADAPESVKFTPTPLNLEELSKLWSILFQTSYKLSVAYRASVVQIESPARTQPALPVQLPRLFGGPMGPLELRTVDAVAGPITWGSDIVLTGRGLDRPGVVAEIAGFAVPLEGAASGEARVTLDAATLGGVLAAGLTAARLVRPLGGDAPAHLAERSAAIAFTLQPRIVAMTVTVDPPEEEDEGTRGTLAVILDPPLQENQSALLMLALREGGTTLSPDFGASPAFPLASLDFPFEDLAPQTYLARLEVDGVQSPMTTDTVQASATFGQIIGPEVMIP